MEDYEILEKEGWIVECESPFEIRHEESNSFATGWAADAVLDSYVDGDKLGDIRTLLNAYNSCMLNSAEFIHKLTERMNR